MQSLITFGWLGLLAATATNLYGQRTLHDLVIARVDAYPSHNDLGMGGGEPYDPSHPDKAGNLVVQIVNNSQRNLTINPNHLSVCALGGSHTLYLKGVAFLHYGDVTVPAGKSVDIMKVPLSYILDPTRIEARRTISWNWRSHLPPPTSPIMPNGKDYAKVGVFWVEHMRDQQVVRSQPLVMPINDTKSR